MANITEDELYATVGRLYILWLTEQRDHNQTRQLLAEAQMPSEAPTPLAELAEARPQRKGG